jgi:histidinol dehydrogenase
VSLTTEQVDTPGLRSKVIRKLDKLYGNGGQYFDAVKTEASGQANIRQRSGPASMS